MPGIVVVGAQWGDEGKGKVVDLLTDRAQAVVRFQGGHNAGHTLVINGVKTWCTFGARADVLMLLARTDPDRSRS